MFRKHLFLGFFNITIALSLLGCVTTFEKPERTLDKRKAVEANVKLGMNYIQRGSRDNAQRAFTNALKLDRKSAEAHQGMALIRQLNGETELAEASFKTALKSRADFSMAGIQFSYGRFLYDLTRYEDASKYFNLAAKDLDYPNRSNALYYLGLSADRLGDKIKAKASFEYALNLDPNNADTAIELAEIAFKAEQYSDSKRYLDQHSRNGKQTARSLWLGIRIERIFGNKDKEASYALALKNRFPYSKEYLEFKSLKTKGLK